MFSTFKTPAFAFTPTPPPWLTAWKRRRKREFAFYVLDRPNPLGGEIVEGPMLDADKTNFVAYFPMPVRYGLTIGELAQLFNAENHIGADLHVIADEKLAPQLFF